MTYDIISKRLRKSIVVKKPDVLYNFLKRYTKLGQEMFLTVTLKTNLEIIGIHITTIGLINKTLVHPREVFKHSIRDESSSIIIVHTHPYGNPEPSKEDIEITEQMRKSGDILGINVLDHLIITRKGYFSFSKSRPLLDQIFD